MAKTLKQFLEGYLKVKSADEQKFIDKHVTAKNPDRNGNGDDVFKGSTKAIDRRKERKGYNPGEDEKVYEELKGGQKKLDKNKNGKLDAHDFKLLRKKKVNEASYKDGDTRMGSVGPITTDAERAERAKKYREKMMKKEEAEQIDELSRDTLRRYRMKAKSIGDNEKGDINYRSKGRDLAARKTHGGQWGIPKAKVMAKEEAEQIDELSKQTLRSYAQNAKDQMSRSDTIAGREMGARNSGAKPSAKERMHNRRADKRHAGLGLAIDKLAREEVELDEKLSAKTPMGTYIKDFEKSDAPQFKGKSPAKRRVMAIAAKLTAERGGKPLRKEERLIDCLGDLSESHQRVMLEVFEKLNEDNKSKFMEACTTPEGVDQMLDFAIRHRGE